MATLKILKSFKEIGVNGGNISKAMRAAGYAESTSKRTDKLTKRKGWQELMEKFISDKELARVHQEGLNATTFFTEGLGKGETQLVEKPDYSVRHKYLESGYKIKGKLKEVENPQQSALPTIINLIMPDGTTSNKLPPVIETIRSVQVPDGQ